MYDLKRRMYGGKVGLTNLIWSFVQKQASELRSTKVSRVLANHVCAYTDPEWFVLSKKSPL